MSDKTCLQYWIEDDPDGPEGFLGAWSTQIDVFEDQCGDDVEEFMRLQETTEGGGKLADVEIFAFEVATRYQQRMRTRAETVSVQMHKLARNNLHVFYASIKKRGFWVKSYSSPQTHYLVTDISSKKEIKFRTFIDDAEVFNEPTPDWTRDDLSFWEAARR